MITLSSEIQTNKNITGKECQRNTQKTMISYGRNVVKCVKFMIPPLSSYRAPQSVTVHVGSEHNVPPRPFHMRDQAIASMEMAHHLALLTNSKRYYEHLFSPSLRIQILCSEIKTYETRGVNMLQVQWLVFFFFSFLQMCHEQEIQKITLTEYKSRWAMHDRQSKFLHFLSKMSL